MGSLTILHLRNNFQTNECWSWSLMITWWMASPSSCFMSPEINYKSTKGLRALPLSQRPNWRQRPRGREGAPRASRAVSISQEWDWKRNISLQTAFCYRMYHRNTFSDLEHRLPLLLAAISENLILTAFPVSDWFIYQEMMWYYYFRLVRSTVLALDVTVVPWRQNTSVLLPRRISRNGQELEKLITNFGSTAQYFSTSLALMLLFSDSKSNLFPRAKAGGK